MPNATYSSLPKRFVITQCLTLLLVTLIVLLLGNVEYAKNTLIGMSISVLSSLVYLFMLDFKPGTAASSFFMKFTIAEGLKFLLVIILMGLAFKYLDVIPFFVLIGFIVSLLSVWFFVGYQVITELKKQYPTHSK